MENNGTGNKAGLIINIILTIVGLAGACGAFGDAGNVITKCITVAMYLLISYYIFYSYKVPHGNLLRWVVMIFALSLLFPLNTMIKVPTATGVIALAAAMVFIAFIAGRLGKLKQNIVYAVIITLAIIAACLAYVIESGAVRWTAILLAFAPLIMWINIAVAYFTRYKEHREAGQEEK